MHVGLKARMQIQINIDLIYLPFLLIIFGMPVVGRYCFLSMIIGNCIHYYNLPKITDIHGG